MNNKGEVRNMNFILIVLLYLAIYCTTSTFVKQLDPSNQTIQDPVLNDNLKSVRDSQEHDIKPKNMKTEIWNILKNIFQKSRNSSDSLSNTKYITPIPSMGAWKRTNTSIKSAPNEEQDAKMRTKTNVFMTEKNQILVNTNKMIPTNKEIQVDDNQARKGIYTNKTQQNLINLLTSYQKLHSNLQTVLSNNNRNDSLTINSSSLSYSALIPKLLKIPVSLPLNEHYIRLFVANNTLNLATSSPYVYDPSETTSTFSFVATKAQKPNQEITPIVYKDYHDGIIDAIQPPTTANDDISNKNVLNASLKEIKLREECLDEPRAYGICNHLINLQAWSYIAEFENCFEFAYSGCGSSRNIFWTKKECVEFCRHENTKIEYENNEVFENDYDAASTNGDDDDEYLDVNDDYSKEDQDYDPNKNTLSSEIEEEIGNDSPENSSPKSENNDGNFSYEVSPGDVLPHWERQNHVYTRMDAKESI